MNNMSRMLVAVGADEASLSAAKYALALSKQVAMAPTLFHVEEYPAHEILKMRAAGTGEIDIKKADALRKLLKLQQDLGVDLDTIVRLGDISEEIKHVINLNLNVDWLVVGRRNKGAVAKFILGRVSEQITRAVEHPVLVVPPEVEHPGRSLNVMVTTDLTPGATAAFKHAARLANGGRLTVFHVYGGEDWSDSKFNVSEADFQNPHGYKFDFEKKAEKGDPATLIAKAVDEMKIDMLVCATHARQGINKLIAGSVTEGLLSKVRIPTLIVRRSAINVT